VSNAAHLARRVDAFCARLNGGLAAVAIVLAALTAALLVVRLPQVLPQADTQTSSSPDNF
jgi:hypothetical protein